MFPYRNIKFKVAPTMARQIAVNQLGGQHAVRFGHLIRERRKALNMNQDDVALATGVGRRFIIDLEGGKVTAQLGKALQVLAALGCTVEIGLPSRRRK